MGGDAGCIRGGQGDGKQEMEILFATQKICYRSIGKVEGGKEEEREE